MDKKRVDLFHYRSAVSARTEPVSPEPLQEPGPVSDRRRRGIQLSVQVWLSGKIMRAKHERTKRQQQRKKIQKKVTI